jgi:Fe-Mn family superoxide dismutase
VFGSGWAWLFLDDGAGRLQIGTTQNQDTPAMNAHEHPILTLDIWEHACVAAAQQSRFAEPSARRARRYYLKWQNRRAEWIQEWWNIVDWVSTIRRPARACGMR